MKGRKAGTSSFVGAPAGVEHTEIGKCQIMHKSLPDPHSGLPNGITRGLLEKHERQHRLEYARQVEAFLKMCDEFAAETLDEVDAAKDIREIREDRMARL